MYCANCGIKYEGNFCPNCGTPAQIVDDREYSTYNTINDFDNQEKQKSNSNNNYYPEFDNNGTNSSTDNNINSNSVTNISGGAILKRQPWFSAKIVTGIISILFAVSAIIITLSSKIFTLIPVFAICALGSAAFMLIAGIITVAKNNSFGIAGCIVSSVFYFITFALSAFTNVLYSYIQVLGCLSLSFCIFNLASLIARRPGCIYGKAKKAILIVSTVLVCILAFFFAIPAMNNIPKIDLENSVLSAKKEVNEEAEKSIENEKYIEEKYKLLCAEIDFETLSRNPDKYKGTDFVFTGEVIQVQEPYLGNSAELRVNITKNTFEYIEQDYYTDTIYATVNISDGQDRILEGDIITFWGKCDGKYSYTSIFGENITLPKIDIRYFEIK